MPTRTKQTAYLTRHQEDDEAILVTTDVEYAFKNEPPTKAYTYVVCVIRLDDVELMFGPEIFEKVKLAEPNQKIKLRIVETIN